ncbi:hypothetical protein CYMTET_21138 [Cymbomonas tetramitiformis]|uniref:PROP1-like PPR domain-containing protein n=1 Tax=Cymbomonas tetramitiformis TaxID=36881 RepID=A0AAE0L3G5_9CHLO|nr:hypothetical protein CYMTET_21138 [Cymbomonas tetramitiformis]
MGAAGLSCGGSPRKPVILSAGRPTQHVRVCRLRLGHRNTSAPSLARGCREARLSCASQEAARGSTGEGIPGAAQPAEKTRLAGAREERRFLRIIAARKAEKRWRKALALFARMKEAGMEPDMNAYSSLIRVCGKAKHLEMAFEGQWEKALKVFEGMKEPGAEQWAEPNVITYSKLIKACEKGRQLEMVIASMKKAGVEPNVTTYNSLISVCEKGGQSEKALEVFAGMKKEGMEPNVAIQQLISVNEKEAGSGSEAGSEDSVSTFNSLIKACGKGGQWEKALEVFAGMKEAGVKPNGITYGRLTRLISVCTLDGQWEKALEVFAGMKEAGVEPNVTTYNSLISACGKGEQWEKALEVFAGMKEAGVEPNVITYSKFINVCETGGQWEQALEVFAGMKKSGVKPNVSTFNRLLNVLWVDGQFANAINVAENMFPFDSLPSGFSLSGNSSFLDLHGTSSGSAKCLTLIWLSAVEESCYVNRKSHPAYKMEIVTDDPDARTFDVEVSVDPAMFRQAAELEKILVTDLRCLTKQLRCKGYAKLRKSECVGDSDYTRNH